MKVRLTSLDALRGIAILAMVLSSSIAFGPGMPAWMFHAQVPPPNHVFNPALPGITWVDLVFPFFLFSMGAAFPLALSKKSNEQPFYKVLIHLLQRFTLLVFFAIFTFHARAWVMRTEARLLEHLLSILGFIVLFLIYSNWQNFFSKTYSNILKIAGILLALIFLIFYPFASGSFKLSQSDIIIIVLANMSLFGALAWYFTRNNILLRIGILPFVMAVFFMGKETGNWNYTLFNFSPALWLYKFYYLKYLFIIIPGTIAGDWLLEKTKQSIITTPKNSVTFAIALLSLSLIFVNLWGLFSRELVINLILNSIISLILFFLINKEKSNSGFYKKLLSAGIYLLFLGLFFEAYEGGIKKDFSTYSYYFVTSGLAFLTLLSLIIFEEQGYLKSILKFFADNGKNPMIAYTAGNLLLIPLLQITGTLKYLDLLQGSLGQGLLRGLIFTGIVSLITTISTRAKLFWKT
jgi:predicted acyltransferase